ncbi:MAG: metalloregulator ArsR/SmtB family transcription factor, partial [Trichococcus flocculiformis]
MTIEYKIYAKCLKVLSDETRLEIMDLLSEGEMCACALLDQFSITQPTLSYH